MNVDDWPDDEMVPFTAEQFRYLRRLSRSPEAWREALVRAREPLPHPAGCWCLSCHASRLTHANDYLDERLIDERFVTDPEQQEDSMPRPRKTTPPPTLPCRDCGLAVEVEPRAKGWPICTTCRHADRRDLIAAALAALGIEDPIDPAVWQVFGGIWWKAAYHRSTSAVADRNGHTTKAGAFGDYTGPTGTGAAQPWAHLDAKAIRKAIAQARRTLNPSPHRNKAGKPCSACGVRAALRWVQCLPGGGLGSLLMCGDCALPWQRLHVAGSAATPLTGDAWPLGMWRDWLCADALGVPELPDRQRRIHALAAQVSFAAYCEAEGTDPTGYDQRFGYLGPDAVEAARQYVFNRRETLAPREWRARKRRRRLAEAAVVNGAPPPPPPSKGPGLVVRRGSSS